MVWSVRLDSEAAASALSLARHTDRDLVEFAAAPDAANRLLRRRLARALLGRLGGLSYSDILFGRSADGAPSVLSPKDWHVSVAGRAPLCLIGVSPLPIGVDVEPTDDVPPLWDMLTPAEGAAIERLPIPDQPLEWLRRWTGKEAHAKRLGFARRADPARIQTEPNGQDRLLVRSDQGSSDCRLRLIGGRIEAVAL